MIDTRALSLTVLSAQHRELARFDNIALGSGGVADMHYAGNAVTPTGTYRIAWVNRRSRFRIFFGLDYPTRDQAARALRAGVITAADYAAISAAHGNGILPPQHTGLGGSIGIHGIGAGDPRIHRHINWTDGCIALGNEEAMMLARWLDVGTKVVIR